MVKETKTFEIEYTTNHDDRKTVKIQKESLTDAYLAFVADNPKHYIITHIKEM